MNLARSSFYLTATNIALAALTSLNFFFLAAALSPKQLGILSILLAIPSIGFCLLSFGYNKAAIYYVGRKVYSLETVLTNGISICILLESFLGILLLGFRPYIIHLFSDISFKLFCVAVLSTPIQIFLFYLADACLAAERLAITLWVRSFSPIVYVMGCVLAGLNGKLNEETAFIFYVLGIFLASSTGLGWVFFKSQSKRLFRPSIQAAGSCLKFGWKAQPGELAQYLALRLDLILVGFWAGMEASGYYSVATRLAETIWLIAYSTQSALSAKVAQVFQETLYDKGRRIEKAVRYITTISFLVSIGIISSSYLVFNFFLTQYRQSFRLLLILIPGQIALGVFLLMIANLLGDGHPLLATKIQITLLALSLLFYIAFIPILGDLGASIATSITYLTSAAIISVILADMYQIRMLDLLLWKREDLEYIKASKQYLTKYFTA